MSLSSIGLEGKKRLSFQQGNDPDAGWSVEDVSQIGPSLSFAIDVTKAETLAVNSAIGGCFQGQTHGHEGFLLESEAAKILIRKTPDYAMVVYPFLIADDLIGRLDAKPTRYVIDFRNLDLLEAQHFPIAFQRVQKFVLPDRQKAAAAEESQNHAAHVANPRARLNHHHANFLRHWWRLSWDRGELMSTIGSMDRYIVCGRVTKRPIFEFISREIHPNDSLQVFPYDDDYSFGILQSHIHWLWFTERCSTLKSDWRYTSNTVFDSFPWPQLPDIGAARAVAKAAVALRTLRSSLRDKHKISFRDLYRGLDLPGEHSLKDAQEALDTCVLAAYGMHSSADPLEFLLSLNLALAGVEKDGGSIQGPGLPPCATDLGEFKTGDCVSV